jgi:hypothetical protein
VILDMAPESVRARVDAELREVLEARKRECGWSEIGGRLIRDEYGRPVGRTKWAPFADWWPGRPGAYSPRMAQRIIDKAIAGCTLGRVQRQFVAYLLDTAELSRSCRGIHTGTCNDVP